MLEPIIEPRLGIDGWSYTGTSLEECVDPHLEPELAQAVHLITSGLATAWNYRRAIQLLESQRAYGQAYAILEAWATDGPEPDGSLSKWRARLAAGVLRHGGGAF
ncbi:MAG: hypothetical protein HOV87_19435 [Catenulispora sp.]|nr:hypothetical protein [Catenulispora sp.]